MPFCGGTPEAIANGVADAHAFLSTRDDVVRSQHGQLLRHDRLIETEDLLQFLHGAVALDEPFQDANPHRVCQGAKEAGLEDLQIVGRRIGGRSRGALRHGLHRYILIF